MKNERVPMATREEKRERLREFHAMLDADVETRALFLRLGVGEWKAASPPSGEDAKPTVSG
jgi:hypothetical protein